MKAIAEIAKTTSVVPKEVQINQAELTVPVLIHRSGNVLRSITGYKKINEHPNGADPLQWIKLKSRTQLLHIKESPRFKPQKIKKQPLWRKVHYIYVHLLSILSGDANEAGSLGRIECCVLIGSVQSGTETVSSKQR